MSNVTELRVKADPIDIDPEQRKKNVKKLAGAIAHSLRSGGEVNIRAFGNPAISKSAKALSIARKFIGVQNLDLGFAPAFISSKPSEHELTGGISFCTFANEKLEDQEEIDFNKVKISLLVSADSADMSSGEKKSRVRKLAGAISHALEENKEVLVRCVGPYPIGKAARAIAIARGMTAQKGADLYAFSYFIMASMGEENNQRTGICFYCYTNELTK